MFVNFIKIAMFSAFLITFITAASAQVLTKSTNLSANSLEQRLFQACRDLDKQEVKRLLDEGANINARNEFGQTPLMAVSSFAINIKTPDGKTDLGRLQQVFDQDEIVTDLLRRNPDLNIQDQNGETVLMYSAELANPFWVKKILAQGGKVFLKNTRGKTAKEIAAGNYADSQSIAYLVAVNKGTAMVNFGQIIKLLDEAEAKENKQMQAIMKIVWKN